MSRACIGKSEEAFAVAHWGMPCRSMSITAVSAVPPAAEARMMYPQGRIVPRTARVGGQAGSFRVGRVQLPWFRVPWGRGLQRGRDGGLALSSTDTKQNMYVPGWISPLNSRTQKSLREW